MHQKESNVEIVAFATHPNYKGQEIMKTLDKVKYKTIYFLVRAISYGLNTTLSKHGFSIRDTSERMNFWYFKRVVEIDYLKI